MPIFKTLAAAEPLASSSQELAHVEKTWEQVTSLAVASKSPTIPITPPMALFLGRGDDAAHGSEPGGAPV